MKRHSEIARQGTNDGLCGVYCLINAVRLWDSFEGAEEEDLLRYFLESAHRLNNFHPYKISNGYEAHELTDIFNEFARAHDYPAKASLLRTCLTAFPKLSFGVLAKRIFEDGGVLVASMPDGGHWLLAHSYDFERKKFVIQDSDVRDEKTHRSSSQLAHIGVVILPVASTIMATS